MIPVISRDLIWDVDLEFDSSYSNAHVWVISVFSDRYYLLRGLE